MTPAERHCASLVDNDITDAIKKLSRAERTLHLALGQEERGKPTFNIKGAIDSLTVARKQVRAAMALVPAPASEPEP